ncbi:uncharacterized protein LOC117176302 isoform X2 [Belonocnema kinseyi]|uniref:uncharacterized protein LOC117176302 isoform X2 n=1 Tax=Belonocnema kinseyi TaxID=2817044 RepID=UPI00143D297D|nr:uncharacterized protein LOC117176302 isoform X2 [Belonocnema kinseyi]
MSRVNIILACSLLVLLPGIPYTQGMQCDLLIGSTCPSLFSSPDANFCCPESNGRERCCTKEEFFFTPGSYQVVLPIILGVSALVVIFICCVCCACCRKKRERGAVYVRGPSTIVQVNQNPPANYGQNPYPPAQPAGMPQPPPAYTNEVYSKQSPYNPNYPNP